MKNIVFVKKAREEKKEMGENKGSSTRLNVMA
jgi:hypothetical protein